MNDSSTNHAPASFAFHPAVTFRWMIAAATAALVVIHGSQTAAQTYPNIGPVKELISECAPKRSKVNVLFRSLVASQGRLVKFDADSFYQKKERKYFRSLYRDVLEIRCGDKFVTNVPDPATKRYGLWTEINQVYAGTKIVAVLTDGRVIKGFSNSATESHLIVFDSATKARLDIPREKVSTLFGVIGGRGGVRSGAAAGSEGLLQPGAGDPILGLAGAAIGAIIGAIVKNDGRPILIYSR